MQTQGDPIADYDNTFISNLEAAAILRISPQTLRRSRNGGFLYGKPTPPYYQISPKHCVYKRKEVVAWVEAQVEVVA